MRVGIVCPYSFDAHGGVQVHVMDLADELFRRGHEVQVLAPASQVVGRYDWSAVTDEVLDVYDMALSTAHTRVAPAPGSRTMLGRLRDALDD